MPATLLIPLYRDEVAPRFDLAGEALLVHLDADGAELSRSSVLLAHASSEELCRIALEEKVRAVICNGIDDEFWQYLRWKRIEVIDNVMGPVDEAIARFRADVLRPGDILFHRSDT
ncbi:NifB/NifX family molybdenum-iron cluster-binding protein [Nitratidesulfovibrio liaohensis]|uniref:NifB/NifX family molybdenum-iron cluster-binding protein n=1 Tax=Nitratidesulfovibrio liaohensis TaxID=2604158 RepID=A0ABY9QZU6_9BACT|nr:NifB/NifX family molybdenum-iron cluster-binding protein [Nitratidesulfovibrio liaohensis]WMW64034.1 NifB/NifX family molybdenum-iron cluster-binding protein [Nitratidesulfovibrio liaohensis]